MRQILKNAKIYDGTGAAPYTADILLEGDRIARIAEGIDLPADQVIDLKGKSVAPGFIDGHSHNDWFAIKNDPLPYFEPFIRQGIATFVTGNCGLSTVGFEEGNEHIDLMGGGLFGFGAVSGVFDFKQQLPLLNHIPFHKVDLLQNTGNTGRERY